MHAFLIPLQRGTWYKGVVFCSYRVWVLGSFRSHNHPLTDVTTLVIPLGVLKRTPSCVILRLSVYVMIKGEDPPKLSTEIISSRFVCMRNACGACS